MTLQLWPRPAAVKVKPADQPPAVAQPVAVAKGARGEGTAVQVVLTSDTTLTGCSPELSALTGPQGVVFPPQQVSLYRVDYVQVTNPSDAAGTTGEWPDALRPIGKDRYYQEDRNGAPFDLTAGRNQSVWIDFRIPRSTIPGDYSGSFSLHDGAGNVLASIPLRLTVWSFELPPTPSLPTTYGFSRGTAFAFHYQKSTPQGTVENQQADELAQRYLQEAADHRITLDVVDAYVAGTPPNYNWSAWDPFVAPPGVAPSSFPVPAPVGLNLNNIQNWTPAQQQAATAFWAVVAQRYSTFGWIRENYLYTRDEPNTPADQQIAVAQSQAVHQGSPLLRSLVTHAYDAALEPGNFDIWVPNVIFLDPARTGSLDQPYVTKQAAGKRIWWYDSNNSNFGGNYPAQGGAAGRWPDEFIDHPGVNQLVHGPLTYRYGLDGYLYYNTLQAYSLPNADPWRKQYVPQFGTNGDGTLFYPGTPAEIGPAGGHHIAVPSVRLQIMRQSWSMFDMFRMLAERGRAAEAEAIAANLVPTTTTWTADPAAFESAREQLATALQPAPSLRIVTDRSTFSESEVGAGPVDFPRSFYVLVDNVLPAQLGLLTIPNGQAERDAVAPVVTATRPTGSVPDMSARCEAVAGEGATFDPYLVQRVTFTYTVQLASTAPFDVSGVGQEHQNVTLTAASTLPTPLQATAFVALIRQPNPYLLDGPVPWLSDDTRVFQVSTLKPPPFTTAAPLPTDAGSALAFLTTVLAEFDADPSRYAQLPGGAEESQLELSPTRQQQPVFNFAIARIRYRGQSVPAPDVRVFFRLFTTAATGLEYHVNGNYRRSAAFGPAIALLGAASAGSLTTIPFFAVPRVDTSTVPMTAQADPANVKTMPAAGGPEVQRFFGAWLDINQLAPQFPADPGASPDGNWASDRQSIQDLIRNKHQCLVAEIYFVPTATTGDPIPDGANPAGDDNLGQRNLVIVESANPGTPESRTVQSTLLIQPGGELLPPPAELDGASEVAEDDRPVGSSVRWTGDELMISWPTVPSGTRARITFSTLKSADIVELAAHLGRPPILSATQPDTIAFEAGGVTYIPLTGGRTAIPALLTVELPEGVTAGESYRVLVQQIVNRQRIVGSVEVLIPVRHAAELLGDEEHGLAIFRNIHRSVADNDPWKPVLTRYVDQMAERVRGFGGNPDLVQPSPWGTDEPPKNRGCLRSAARAALASVVAAWAWRTVRRLGR
jgi:hypothetical protein